MTSKSIRARKLHRAIQNILAGFMQSVEMWSSQVVGSPTYRELKQLQKIYDDYFAATTRAYEKHLVGPDDGQLERKTLNVKGGKYPLTSIGRDYRNHLRIEQREVLKLARGNHASNNSTK